MQLFTVFRYLLLCLLLCCISCNGADTSIIGEEKGESIFDVLSQSNLLRATLITNIDSLILNKEDELYQTARLIHKDPNGLLITDTIEISARGKTRKNYCSIPPIKLRFSEEYLTKRSLAGIKTLKMVIPCRNDDSSQDLILREYLCYRLCHIVTGNSFRAQLVDLNLQDEHGQRIDHIDYAFIIEHEKDMSQRLGEGLVDETAAKVKAIKQADYNLLVLFQYMIANTDWNLSARHNIKLVNNGPTSAPTPVPYDFDYCGLVNADYAIPHPNLPVKSIRDRFFQWRGKDMAGLEMAMDEILDKKAAILSEIEQFDMLSKESQRDLMDFLNPFFETISADDRLEILLPEKVK